MRHAYHPGQPPVTPRTEARRRKALHDGINPDETTEYAYSAATGAVGIRNHPTETFRVFNVYCPMYGKSDAVHDWQSVGVARSRT